MLTIFSNEIDVEMSDQNSENLTEYKIPDNRDDDYDDDDIFSSVDELSAPTKESNSISINSESYSYYDKKSTFSSTTECKTKLTENDHFDANDLHGIYKDIDFTGDKVDSGDSNKPNIVSKFVFEQALKLNQLRREIVCKSKSNYKNSRFEKHNSSKSNNTMIHSRKNECLASMNKYSSSPIASKGHRSNYRMSTPKEMSDMDSITLLIRVPRSKLMSHIKNKSLPEKWKSLSSKSSSCESLSSSSDEKDSETLQENSTPPDASSENLKVDSSSESNITSILDRSKEMVETFKTYFNKSNKKLQTLMPDTMHSTNQSDKITQTLNTPHESMTNADNNVKNYFLCNICHKIVPANLSPVCSKLSCSAIKKCNLIFHGELDMIMHLPVKHTNEFASYHICSKCNRMYHPSNIVTVKGSYTCLDCITTLAQLTIVE